MSDGYFYLYRKTEDNPVLQDDRPFDKFHSWVWMLGHANHKSAKIMFNGKLTTVKRGQFITSVRKMAAVWKWSPDAVLRFLRLLEANKMIRRVSNTSRTLITIENYNKYQPLPNTDKDTNKDTDKDTNKAQTIKRNKGHGQHRSDDRASAPFNDPRYYDIDPGEPEPW